MIVEIPVLLDADDLASLASGVVPNWLVASCEFHLALNRKRERVGAAARSASSGPDHRDRFDDDAERGVSPGGSTVPVGEVRDGRPAPALRVAGPNGDTP